MGGRHIGENPNQTLRGITECVADQGAAAVMPLGNDAPSESKTLGQQGPLRDWPQHHQSGGSPPEAY